MLSPFLKRAKEPGIFRFSKYQIPFLILTFLLANSFLYSDDDWYSSAPYISPATFRMNSEHFYDWCTQEIEPELIQYGDVVYVTDHYLDDFFRDIHPQIKKPYVLLSNSDKSMPGHFAKYLDDPKVLAWFGRNAVTVAHPKLFLIPIGLPSFYPPEDRGSLKLIEQAIATNTPKKHLVYMNFLIQTFRSERNLVHKKFINKPYVHATGALPYKAYLHELKSAKFVLSPRGNGIDCFRTWEAILMGAIPIVKTSLIDPLFKDLPVLIVNDWDEVTEEFLNEKYAEMQLKSYNWETIYIQYWLDQIHSYKK